MKKEIKSEEVLQSEKKEPLFSVVTKEETVMKDVEVEKDGQIVIESQEVIEPRKYWRETTINDEPFEFKIQQIERQIQDDDAEITRRQISKAKLQEKLDAMLSTVEEVEK